MNKKAERLSAKKLKRQWKRLRHKRLLVFVILPVAILLMHFELVPKTSSYIQTASTPAEVKAAYNEGEHEFTAETSVEVALKESGVAEQEIGRTITSVCYIRVRGGGGWTVAGYSQVCYARITRGYYTNQTISQAVDSLMATSSGQELFTRFHIDNYKDDCILSDYGAPAKVTYVYKNAIKSSQGEYGYLDYRGCGRPSEVQGVGSVRVRELGTDLSIRHIETLESSSYDDSRNQVWIEKDHEYFDQPIVCKPRPISILGSCDLSRSQPVQ